MRFGWATLIAAGADTLRSAFAQSSPTSVSRPPIRPTAATLEPRASRRAADFTLRIAPMMVELAPHVVISTIGYSNKVPGPLLRMREGQRVAVEVVNDTDVPEYVHWHGLFVPSDVDGAEEEGTPPVPPHGRRRYQFVAKPAGSRWYHSHTEAMLDLHRGSYTGQFGFLMIDSANDPGLYDQEVFLALREWEPYLSHDGSGRSVGGSQRPDARKTRHTGPASQRARSQRSSLLDQRQNAGRGGAPPREAGSAHPDAPAQRQRLRKFIA